MSSTGGVWVLVERRDEKLEDGSLELVGHGREVASKTGQELAAVIFGEIPGELVTQLARYGASRVLCIKHPAAPERSVEIDTQLLSAAIEQHSPDIVLSLESITGADIARRLAARLGTGLVTA